MTRFYMVMDKIRALCDKTKGVVTEASSPKHQEFELEAKLRAGRDNSTNAKGREEARNSELATVKGKLAASRVQYKICGGDVMRWFGKYNKRAPM